MYEPSNQSPVDLAASLRAQQRESWQRGQRVLVETLIDNHSDAQSSDETVLELLYAEFCLREELGEVPEAEEYYRRFPHLRLRLGNLFEMHSALADGHTDSPEAATPDDTLNMSIESSVGSLDNTQANHGNGDAATAGTQTKFGDYELFEEIARGGMGVVYKARQIKANRTVALKMILAGQFASPADVQRFYSEAEAAANLDHPNIVPIYDVGRQDGQHYFSMGYVDGQSLTQVVADGPLASREAASLLAQVADAVHYANERGVIHRDLKPANVLLADDGQPRVTDFGLAKRLESGDGPTASGDVLGTPSYMPPEQAMGKKDEIGPAVDVYSLGAILYCLVTGRPPFQAATVLDTLAQVIDQEPVSPRQLNPALDKDVETIALKCLQKESARRYASAAELAAELRRYLSGESIRARPVGTAERTWRWCKRKPIIAGLSATAVGLSLLVVLLLAVGYRRESALRHEAEAARGMADDNARQADAQALVALRTLESVVFDIQQELANVPAAHSVRQNLLDTAIDRLQEVARSLETSRKADLNLAVAHLELGDVFLTVGGSGGRDGTIQAHRQYQRGNDILRELSSNKPDEWLVQQNLSVSYERLGDTLRRLGKPANAREAYEKGLQVISVQRDRNPANVVAQADVASGHSKLGEVACLLGDVSGAIVAHTKSLDALQVLAEEDPTNARYQRDMSVCYARLGKIRLWQSDADSARDYYERCLAIRKRLAQAESMTTDDYQAQRDLSAAYRQLGDLHIDSDIQQAQKHYQKALAIIQQAVESDPNNLTVRHSLAIAYGGVGEVSLRTGDVPSAREYFQKGQQILSSLADHSPSDLSFRSELAFSLIRLGNANRRHGELPEAIAAFQKSLSIYEGLADGSPANMSIQQNLAIVNQHLGEAYQLAGDCEAALRHFEADLAIRKRLAELDDRQTNYQLGLSIAHGRVGDAQLQLHHTTADSDGYEKAVGHHQQSVSVVRRLAEAHPQDARIQYSLSVALEKLGDARMAQERTLAREHYEECLEIRKKRLDVDPADARFQRPLSVVYDRLGTVAFLSEDYAAAFGFFNQSLDQARKMVRKNPRDNQAQADLIGAKFKVGNSLQRQYEFAKATQFFQEGLKAYQRFEEQTGLDGWPHLKGYDRTFEEHISICQLYEKVVDDLDFVLSQPKEKAVQYLYQRVPVLIGRGRIAEAAESAEKLAELDPQNGGSLYNAACGFALCSEAAYAECDEPSGKERAQADRYAGRATQSLKQCRDVGYFEDPDNVEWAQNDSDLHSLRKLPEYEALMWSLGQELP